MEKRVLAMFLIAALLVGVAQMSLAADTLNVSEASTEVEHRLAALQNESGFRPGDGNTNCLTFALSVINEIFGIKLSDIEYHGEKETSGGKQGYLIRIGRCFRTYPGFVCNYSSSGAMELNTDNVKALLTQAKCGDMIQTTRKTTAGVNDQYNNSNCQTRHPHTMIVQSIGNTSLVVYEGNMNGGKVNIRTITYEDFANTYNHTITLFRAYNYDEVNGSKTVDSQIRILPTSEPGEHREVGTPFYFRGSITSGSPIISATVSILASDGSILQTRTVNPNKTNVDILADGLDSLKFGKLGEGAYTLVLSATDASGDSQEWSRAFSVGNVDVTPLPSDLTIAPTTFPTENMNPGAPFYFRGSITSTNYDVTTATVSILDSNGNVIQTRTVTPNKRSVDILKDGLDSLKFGQLAEGAYTLALSAADVSGNVQTWSAPFSIGTVAPTPDPSAAPGPVSTPTPTSVPTPAPTPVPTSQPIFTPAPVPTADPCENGHEYRVDSETDTTIYYVCDRCGDYYSEEKERKKSRLPLPTVNVYSNNFSDVKTGDWFYNSVISAYELGLMNGTGKSIFSPDSNVTIAQTVTLAARIHSIYHTGSDDFPSYDGGKWFDPYVDYAKENSILTEAYNYDRPATREEFIHILSKALPEEELENIAGEISFADDDEITYIFDVRLLSGAGIITGIEESGRTYFRPSVTITRAQVAAVVGRMARPELRMGK